MLYPLSYGGLLALYGKVARRGRRVHSVTVPNWRSPASPRPGTM
jgi:hypothetical protein